MVACCSFNACTSEYAVTMDASAEGEGKLVCRAGACRVVADEDELAMLVDESSGVEMPVTYVMSMSRVMGGTGGTHDYLMNPL